ncbi:uncharacterized protein LOC103703932 isoform X2 [Phoenix dactylifera]|uniref:Uncharacterized protein LOC103703932 isoform X2 n=1 Tax=Phoenix dactylifera TaxID=42345 RepID=A0A8B7BTW1_PHODC|nr:uncharacterized protein LOC103703932 isoform X2 [Phoenix dactylifera]
MRLFKKGNKVEVLNKREVPSGSWWCAEIISGNGQNYYVKYDSYPANMGAAVERVSRKAIRPCPPLVKSPSDWVPGDIAEVLDNSSWKLSEVLRVGGDGYFFVRLLGSSREFKVHVSDLRLRQSWLDGKWVVIQKDSGKHDRRMISNLSKGKKFSCQRPWPCLESHNAVVLSRGMKKRPRVSSQPVERCTEASRKMRALEKYGRCEQRGGGRSLQPWEKVDVVASPRRVLGEKCLLASLNNRMTGFSKMASWRGLPNINIKYFPVTSSEPSDAESTSSSVGSCSTSNSPYRSLQCPGMVPTQDLSSHSDDAEISCGSGRESSLPTEEVLPTETHQLELHAYRSTMMALYASGPISWEQEALMTNLRLMLNISNDEHLLELKNLVSSEIGTIPLRSMLEACKACFRWSLMMVKM